MGIYKLNDNWYIDFSCNGKRYREKVGPSHSLAKDVLSKRQNEVAENKYFPERANANKPFLEILDNYWELHGQYFKSPSWAYYYKEVKDNLGSIFIDDISNSDIQKYYNNIRTRTSVSSANRQLTFIKAIFNKAILWKQYFKSNPCFGISTQKEPPHRLRYLTQDEIKALLIHCSERIRPIVTCALLTGMRRSELLNLNWANVSLDRGIIYLLTTKSGKPRELPIPSKLRDLLELIHPKCGSIFSITAQMLRKDFDEAIEKAKILDFTFHGLRHTFASHFIMKTNDLPALQTLLGHASASMTQRYAHLSKGHLASNIAVFESAIPILNQTKEKELTQ